MEQSWLEGMGNTVYLQTTCDNLRRVGTSLKKWSRESFGAIQNNIRKREHKLKSLRCVSGDENEIRTAEKTLGGLFEREEVMARQCSRVN
jgi:hypothetical protein